MKKEKFLRFLRENNCLPTGRQKDSHAMFQNARNGKKAVVPMHNDIAELTARAICKQLDIPPVKFN